MNDSIPVIQQEINQTTPQQPISSSFKRIILIVAAVVLFLAIVGGVYLLGIRNNQITQYISQQQTVKTTPTPLPAIQSGVSGIITIGPTSPVCRNDQPCTKPYQTTVIVKNSDTSQEVTRFTSKADGSFRISLPPGKYLFQPIQSSSFPAQPLMVTVIANHITTVNIALDSGIR